MSHPLVLAMFEELARAREAATRLHALGVTPARLSVVAQSQEREGELAEWLGGTPGAEIEDSRLAARVGEMSAHVVAAVATILPGVGPIIGAGPLAAEFGEAAGHAAGNLASVLGRAGLPDDAIESWQAAVERGAIIIGAHLDGQDAETVEAALAASGASAVARATWKS